MSDQIVRTDTAEQHVDAGKRVSPFELFFDLVFVYAFTQVTRLLAAQPTWTGLAQGLLVLAALWWAWAGYAWLATTTDLAEGASRLVTIVVMCTMLVVGIATPGAFGEHAVAFAVAYAAVRFLHIALYAVMSRDRPALLRNVLALLPGSTVGAALILAAAFVGGTGALVLWAVALVIDYGGPLVINSEAWEVNAAHFAERFGLIFIIALGESLIAIGIGAEELPIDAALVALASLGVCTVAALWWTYFDVVAIVAERRLAGADRADRSKLARDSYSYLHLPMIAGVILFAMGVKTALKHPEESLGTVPALALMGGIAAYLLAQVAFRLRNIRTVNVQRLVVGLVLLACVPAFGTRVPGGVLLGVVSVVTCVLVAYEAVRFRDTRTRIRSRPWEHVPELPRRERG